MRVNIYSQEIKDDLEVVKKDVKETGASFIGIRFYLESSDVLHPPMHPDNDDSAVTFWVKSKKDGFQKGDEKLLADLFRKAAYILEQGYSDQRI